MEAKYQPGLYDPDQSEALMEEAVSVKTVEDSERNGKTVSAVIHGFEGIHGDIVPILVEMLKNAGFDGDINFGTDAYQNMADGKPGMYMFGHGASLKIHMLPLNFFIVDIVQPSEQVQAITGFLDIVTANMTRYLMKWPQWVVMILVLKT